MTTTLLYTEPTLLLWLVTEYTIRIWASGCRSRYQGCQGRLRFAQRPLCIIDAVIILSTLLVIIVGSTSEMFAASTLRGLRFFQILRMVRIDRRAATWKLLASVIWAHRRELLTTVYIGILGLLFSSYLVYLAEKDYHSTKFATFADALWWGVVTLCTVGYGDVVPDTWAGKLIASFSATLGIAFFALPAGILGSGFALKVQQQQRQKHLIRRRVPAALLIQSLWRCYAADEYSISIATWKPHMIPCPSPTTERPFKNNASFVSRFSTRRKDRGANSNNNSGNVSPHSPMVPRRDRNKLGSCSEEEVPDTLQRSHLSLATGLVDQRVDRIAMLKETNNSGSFCSKDQQDGDDSDHTSGSGKYNLKPFQSEDEPDLSPKIRDLTSQEKKAIRALRKIKYFVARKKFREALRPYDVKDVIEQYSAGHVDMLSRVKCLQFRLDQILGKSGSKNKDVYESKVSLSSRIVKVERQVEDIESKLDLLIDLYKDDRRVLLQQHTTNQDTNATETQSAKPRSILIDKQYVSEPSTPILEKHPSKVMLRNHSDLSSRIRKRVTYRLQTPAKSSVPQESRDADNLTNRKPELECRQLESIKSYSVDNDVIDAEGSDVFANQNDAISSAEAEIANTDKSECSPVFETDYSNSPITIDERKPSVKVKLNETRQGRCDDFDQSSIMEDDHVIDKQQDEQTTSVRNGVNTHDIKSNAEVTNTGDHVILMPIGTMQALAADSSDV
ncbi:Potassium voltage-gated channel subfamily KQT member 4 [Mactra antiquata]